MHRASAKLALIGIPLVAVAVAAVALSMGEGEANPKGALAVIFGLVGGLVLLLLFIQGREVAAESRAATAAPSGSGEPVDNPMTVSEAELWSSLAVAPISDESLRARAAGWEAARGSLRTAWVVVVLIFICVPATYLLESFVPLLIGAPLIAGFALIKGLGVIGAGGGLERGYDAVELAIAPLGLTITERPRVGAAVRVPPAEGLQTRVSGALRFAGERHGRAVTVDNEDGASTVRIALAVSEFKARSSDGKLRAKRGQTPAEVEAVLGSIPASTDWKNLTLAGGADGLEVRRRPSGGKYWLCDLWLAERLADGLS